MVMVMVMVVVMVMGDIIQATVTLVTQGLRGPVW
jgi:hypothetical protein